MSLTNSSLPIQKVSNTSSQYYLSVQDITQGQTNKEIVSTDLVWQNDSLLVDNARVRVSSTTNVASTFTTSKTTPTNPKPDDTWYDTLTDIMFRYIDDGDGTFQWVDISSQSNFASTYIPNPLILNYLVVGGGGAGSIGNNEGGGAGGVAVGAAAVPSGLLPGTAINVIVGTGGTTDSGRGSNSAIAISGTVIKGVGGGGGNGGAGGSGGGGLGAAIQPLQNVGIAGVTNYGTAGGARPTSFSGTGGGGATVAGSPNAPGGGGAGGAGYTWPFNGSAYAGGGGGSVSTPFSSGNFGPGGVGGGGAGGDRNGTRNGFAGTPGTGGGGGGASTSPGASGVQGNGGPGTVLVAYGSLSQLFTGGTVTTSPPANPGYFIHTFTSPGSLTYPGAPIPTVTVQYLAVGGGGGGGNGIQTTFQGGGGGGGGVVTGTLVLPLCNPDATYSVTVGTGGAGGYALNNTAKVGLGGNNSTITGCSGAINITALGGGWGSGAGPGGSGGGLGNEPTCLSNVGVGNQPAQPITLSTSKGTYINYGQPGGRATAYAVGGPDSAGGGGGAANIGSNGIASTGGPGGSGYLWPFTGSIYGAGGGGAGFARGGISFGGGTGAGEKYGAANTFHSGGIGNPGYGGGGGGGYGSSVLTQQGSGGPGGPGAVIFAYQSDTILYTGGCISTSYSAPGYIVHTFTSSGTLAFERSTKFAINYLVVGGGGAGGSGLGGINNGGGGGAGGMLYGTTLGTPGTPYTIIVGAGGTGTPLGLPTNNGQRSELSAPGFTTVCAAGGGAGGGMLTAPATTRSGQPGASGGGAFGYGSAAVGSSLTGQGFPGGPSALGGPGSSNFGAGGGGGASRVGGGGSPYHGGCGGAGKIWPYTNSYYAGGGGGANSQQPGSVGLGGVGGGGQGTWNNLLVGRAGAPGLGGGGGGSNSANPAVPAGLVSGFPGGPGSVTLIAPSSRTAVTTGTVGKSYTGISGSGSFTGTTQYLTVPNSTALDLSNQPFTIEGWIYPMGVYSTWNTIITKRGILAASSAWEVGLAENTGYLYFWNGGSVYYSSTTPTAHTWSHWAAVYDGTFMNLYLNGSRIHQIGISNSVDQANNVLIGTAAAETTWQSFFGYMSNLRVSKANTRYTDVTYTIPIGPFTTDVNTSLLTLQSGSLITDASNNAANISNYGAVTASFISPFSTANGTTVYDFTSNGTIVFS